MSDAQRKLSVRLAVEGDAESKQRLVDFAKAGDEAAGRAGRSAREFADGIERAANTANDNVPRLTRFGQTFDVVEGKVKGTLRGINDVRGAIDLVAPGAEGATAGLARLAGTIANVSDVAGTLAAIFLRNPLGLLAVGISAAVVGYISLRESTVEAAKAEESFAKAIEASNGLLLDAAEVSRIAAAERAAAARQAVEAAIADQEKAVASARNAVRLLEADKARIVQDQGGNPGFDADRVLTEPLSRANEALQIAETRLYELEVRLGSLSSGSRQVRTDLLGVIDALDGFGRKPPSAIQAINEEFERTKRILDAGVAANIKEAVERYDELLGIASRRRDLGIADAIEAEAQRTRESMATLDRVFDELMASRAQAETDFQNSIDDAIRREAESTNARQIAGSEIETTIDRLYREAEATRAGEAALAKFNREQEEARVRQEAFNQALKAYGDDLEAVEGAVNRVTEAWRQARGAKDEADALKKSTTELDRAVDQLSRRSSRALADMIVGLNGAKLSASSLIQTLGSDIIEQILRKKIVSPIVDGATSALDGIFGSLFGGAADGAAFDNGRVIPFARGGVVERSTLFPMRGGMGVMGEAGPEAILPLKRLGGGSGPLGVRADIGGMAGVKVVVNDMRGSAGAQPVEVSERRGDDGMREIKILIQDEVNQAMSGGRFDRPMRDRYGAKAPVKRT
ncbi:MAG: hypothetical protein NBV67_00395 [Tagaea sp.]|nr:hypothetical protein [Tagaea sp.]